MTTFESTVALMRRLPEEDLLAINSLVKRLVSRVPVENPAQPISETEFFDRLDMAWQHAETGQVRPAGQFIDDVRARLGCDGWRVLLTSDAEEDLNGIVDYLVTVKLNSDAAISLLEDFEQTIEALNVPQAA